MQRAVIYPRYSSGAQKDVSIDQQVRAAREFADRQGLEIVGIYEDRALTGTNDKRPGFQRMIADSAKGEWEYVIVYTLDRFARDRYDSAVYKRKLKENGVRVLSVMENLTDDPTGVLLESVLEGLAEYYSKELAQKINRGLKDNAEKCMVNGPIPVGFIKGPDGRYAIYEPEAVVIREVFQRFHDGETLTAIMADLNTRDLRTRKGGPWSRSVINRALTNERYAGTYIHGSIRVENGIPPIVSRDLFDAVQVRLATKPNPRNASMQPARRRNENGVYLLTGKLFCGHCESPMVGVSGRGKSGAMHFYYACKKQRVHTCTKSPIRRDVLEQEITQALQTRIFNDETIAAIADAVIAHQAKSDRSLELDSLTAQLTETSRSIRNIMSAIESGIFTPTIQQRLLDLEDDQRHLKTRIAALRAQLGELPTREDIIALLSLYQDGDPSDKDYQQVVLDTFLRAVYVYDDHFDIVFTPGAQTRKDSIPLASTIDAALSGSYNVTDGPPFATIRTPAVQIITFLDEFAFRCPMVYRKNHT